MSEAITCPSGLIGTIRGLKGKEGKLLADRNAARSGATFDQILAACWLSTEDPGPYAIEEKQPLDWAKVLVADRFYSLIRIRALTFGDAYAFSVQCAAASCRERFEWEIRLSELPVRALPAETLAAFQAGNRLETRLPRDGRKVWFKLLTGADEQRAAKAIKAGQGGLLQAALLARLVEVEGVAEHERRGFLDELELADQVALLDRFDEADGGVETSIEVECPSCLSVQELDLPFERGFFLPRAKERAA
ncbi:MAG: T4 family baseplate hub assembly chaperone [Deltaproteobacteria bacterium]